MKTLIVTGGTGGLGQAVVERLSREYKCVLVPHKDFRSDESLRSTIANAGAPYGLVHMAGGYEGATVSETSAETWTNMLDANLTAAFRAIQATLAQMDR